MDLLDFVKSPERIIMFSGTIYIVVKSLSVIVADVVGYFANLSRQIILHLSASYRRGHKGDDTRKTNKTI